tara:strand:+ start:4396 stop:4791 length:396 start_codon:yes stop_codon:yes gene_type:complete
MKKVIRKYSEAIKTLQEYDLKPIQLEISDEPNRVGAIEGIHGKYEGFEFDTLGEDSELLTFLIVKCTKEEISQFEYDWIMGSDFLLSDEKLHDDQKIFDFQLSEGVNGDDFIFLEKSPPCYSQATIKYLSK